MKKFFSFIAAILFAGSMMAEALELYTLDATLEANKGTNNGYATNCDITVGTVIWNVTGNSTMSPWRIGGKSLSGVDREVYSKTAFGSALDSIVLEIGAASGVTINSIKLTHSLNSDFSEGTDIAAASPAANSSMAFAPAGGFPANSYFKITFNLTITATSNKFIEFKEVRFWGQAPTEPEISCADVLDFGVVFGKAPVVSKILEVSAFNLTEDIAAELEIGDAFALSAATLDKEGGELEINLAPSVSAVYNDILTLSANGAKKEVELSAVAVITEHDGDNSDPFSVDEAIIIALSHADGASTKDSVSVKGVVVNVLDFNDGRLSFSIGTANDTVLCYRTYDAEGQKTLTADTLKAGNEVVVRGKLQNYKSGENNIPEVAYGKLISIKSSPTAIVNARTNDKAIKRIENGQLVIIKNGVKYNAVGTVVR